MARQIAHPLAGEHKLTMPYETFLAWADEDTFAEWVDGEVTVFMPPKPIHQDLSFFFARLLALFVDLSNAGKVMVAPFEMRLRGGRSSREPDVAFVASEYLTRLTADRLEGPADLVVEVVSEDSVTRDWQEKFREYEVAGVREYWIVDSRENRRGVAAFHLSSDGRFEPIRPDADGRYRSIVLPGFWLDPEWLRQDPLPEPLTILATISPQALLHAVTRALPSNGSETAGR